MPSFLFLCHACLLDELQDLESNCTVCGATAEGYEKLFGMFAVVVVHNVVFVAAKMYRDA
eukprot:SAG31_NODE_11148_length_1061_cov_0.778586_2_plen_60_part_00